MTAVCDRTLPAFRVVRNTGDRHAQDYDEQQEDEDRAEADDEETGTERAVLVDHVTSIPGTTCGAAGVPCMIGALVATSRVGPQPPRTFQTLVW